MITFQLNEVITSSARARTSMDIVSWWTASKCQNGRVSNHKIHFFPNNSWNLQIYSNLNWIGFPLTLSTLLTQRVPGKLFCVLLPCGGHTVPKQLAYIETESVPAGVDATVYVWLLCTYEYIWHRNQTYSVVSSPTVMGSIVIRTC